MKVDLLFPGLPAKADHFLFGICSVLLIRSEERCILFDTGPFRVRPMLIAALSELGLTPADIDIIFLTHLHWDHVENLDLFPQARVLVPRVEYEYARSPAPNDWGTPPYVHEMLRGMRVELLPDKDQELFSGIRTLTGSAASGAFKQMCDGSRSVNAAASSSDWPAGMDALAGSSGVALLPILVGGKVVAAIAAAADGTAGTVGAAATAAAGASGGTKGPGSAQAGVGCGDAAGLPAFFASAW